MMMVKLRHWLRLVRRSSWPETVGPRLVIGPAHLGFDHAEVAPTTLRDRAMETRRWLREMERLGAVVLEWDRDNVQVLEPRPKDETPPGLFGAG